MNVCVYIHTRARVLSTLPFSILLLATKLCSFTSGGERKRKKEKAKILLKAEKLL